MMTIDKVMMMMIAGSCENNDDECTGRLPTREGEGGKMEKVK